MSKAPQLRQRGAREASAARSNGEPPPAPAPAPPPNRSRQQQQQSAQQQRQQRRAFNNHGLFDDSGRRHKFAEQQRDSTRGDTAHNSNLEHSISEQQQQRAVANHEREHSISPLLSRQRKQNAVANHGHRSEASRMHASTQQHATNNPEASLEQQQCGVENRERSRRRESESESEGGRQGSLRVENRLSRGGSGRRLTPSPLHNATNDEVYESNSDESCSDSHGAVSKEPSSLAFFRRLGRTRFPFPRRVSRLWTKSTTSTNNAAAYLFHKGDDKFATVGSSSVRQPSSVRRHEPSSERLHMKSFHDKRSSERGRLSEDEDEQPRGGVEIPTAVRRTFDQERRSELQAKSVDLDRHSHGHKERGDQLRAKSVDGRGQGSGRLAQRGRRSLSAGRADQLLKLVAMKQNSFRERRQDTLTLHDKTCQDTLTLHDETYSRQDTLTLHDETYSRQDTLTLHDKTQSKLDEYGRQEDELFDHAFDLLTGGSALD